MTAAGTHASPSTQRSTEHRSTEGDTRRMIMETLLKHGPISAADLGQRLGISAAGVRRHLDILVSDGAAESVNRRVPGAGRGRPAKHFRLTEDGKESFGHTYDALAIDAIDALREVGGFDAVRHFADSRMVGILEDVEPLPDGASDEDVAKKVEELAELMSKAGYATTVSRAGAGVQLCNHHCPVSAVAGKHPELCDAEREAFSRVLGRHIQPLASIRNGHGLCTTNIPLHSIDDTPNERSDS